jgi:hypothetical protein
VTPPSGGRAGEVEVCRWMDLGAVPPSPGSYCKGLWFAQRLRLSSAVPPKFLPLYLTHVSHQRSLSPYIFTLYSGSPYIKPLYPTTPIFYTFIIN